MLQRFQRPVWVDFEKPAGMIGFTVFFIFHGSDSFCSEMCDYSYMTVKGEYHPHLQYINQQEVSHGILKKRAAARHISHPSAQR